MNFIFKKLCWRFRRDAFQESELSDSPVYVANQIAVSCNAMLPGSKEV